MHHVGKLLKKAIEESGYSIRKAADEMDIAASTLFRWFEIPNLPVKKVVDVNRALPIVNLKEVYKAMEERLGYEIPENPYRNGGQTIETDPGIKISIDTDKFRGYAIPPDLTQKVKAYIEEYNKQQKK